VTLHRNPIRDTYESLSVLDRIGALGRIDKEACANSLLQFHLGQSLFDISKRGANWTIHGDASDAFCLYESLRILGISDRLSDLRKWQFRTALFRNVNPALPPWDILAAYGLQRRVSDSDGLPSR
jgi:hypothetical protein